jgi:hypothetical protein
MNYFFNSDCFQCKLELDTVCNLHPIIYIEDSILPCGYAFDYDLCACNSVNKKLDAKFTCPKELEIAPSKIRSAGLGVWTLTDIPLGTTFGPYIGEIINEDDFHVQNINERLLMNYTWGVEKTNYTKSRFLINAEDETISNWMRVC